MALYRADHRSSTGGLHCVQFPGCFAPAPESLDVDGVVDQLGFLGRYRVLRSFPRMTRSQGALVRTGLVNPFFDYAYAFLRRSRVRVDGR